MKHQPQTRPPPDPREAGNAVLTQWRMQNEPPPPDGLLRGPYWEDEMPLRPDDDPPRGWVLPVAAALASLGAAIGAALSFVS
jgi:hypothetical protein